MSSQRESGYPITRVVSILLFLVAVAAVLAAWLWGILDNKVFLILFVLYLIIAAKLYLIIRNVEDHDNDASFVTRLFSFKFRIFNRVVPWWRLPGIPGSLNLLAFRNALRDRNLHDTADRSLTPPPWKPEYRTHRTADGTYNDLSDPMMGAKDTRFGRNASPDVVHFDDETGILTPSPREVSQRLLARDQFQPATTLNLLAAAWIQFQNHDWFNHRRKEGSFINVPLMSGDGWNGGEGPMKVTRTEADPKVATGQPPRFINDETHWWDASQLYGSTKEIQDTVRSHEDGKLKVLDNGLLPLVTDPDRPHLVNKVAMTGFNDNWWVGLSLLHSLFTWEHNTICDALAREYPAWKGKDEKLFQTARLINAALIAKIHTVEWTPGILAHPALQVSMNGNWWGLLGEARRKAFGRVSPSEAISGIPGSHAQHHSAPYYLTEEFVSVYRLHPLIPDDYTFRSLADHSVLSQVDFNQLQGVHTRSFVESMSLPDLFYSFGMMHPGAITLKNFPKALMNFERIPQHGEAKGEMLDLGTIDVLRDRERGVPRYNDFREMLRKPRIKKFRDLTDDRSLAEEIESVYEGNIDNVDTLVGMFAEPLPPGFGFSDTAFRIFILMASRRLKSDRFFTDDFTPQVYTPLGMDWINTNNMRSVLLRHLPELGPALARSENAFAPWSRVK